MCGIAGIVGLNAESVDRAIRVMVDRLRHRGLND